MFTGKELFQLVGWKIPESWKGKKHAPKKEEPKKVKARKTSTTVAKKRRCVSDSGDESEESTKIGHTTESIEQQPAAQENPPGQPLQALHMLGGAENMFSDEFEQFMYEYGDYLK